ncbi:MAG: hypothetical protein M1830_004874 [Pleopsidium flavum]|nr:MAG: hypothetical protein M1830_004874 [Pleopsidium flavum]
MSSNKAEHTPATEGELAQAFKDLSKGERTASVMEDHLTSLEKKIDELLASVDEKVPVQEGKSADEPRGHQQGP